MTTVDFWKLAQDGKLCDLTLVEKTISKETKQYSVHRLIMYVASPYFRTMFDSGMADSSSTQVTIETEALELGMLGIVIEAMYATECRAERLYYTFTGEHPISEIMQLYMICSYLDLTEHIKYIELGIQEFINIGELTKWWRDRQEAGYAVPDGVEKMVHTHIRQSIKYIGAVGEAYISIDTLINLWRCMEDPTTNKVCGFLSSLNKGNERVC